MREVGEVDQSALGQGLGHVTGEHGRPVALEGGPGDGGRTPDLVEAVERIAADRHAVHLGLYLRGTLQPHRAVGLVDEPILDVGRQRFVADDIEGWLLSEVVEGLLAGPEHCPSPFGSGRQRIFSGYAVGAALGLGQPWREHDRVEAPQAGEGARPSFLGQEERGPALGMTNPERPLQAERIDDRENVVGKPMPVVGHARNLRRIAVTAEVERPPATPVEASSDRIPTAAVESGGVSEQQRRSIAAEIVDGDLDIVGGANSFHPAILAGGPSSLRTRSSQGGSVIDVDDPDNFDADDFDLDQRAVAETNQMFYNAFEAQDLDAMSDLWEHADRVLCTHPGWTVLRGWGAVGASWMALFQGPAMQFILTNQRVEVAGDMAWVSVDENIIGEQQGSTVNALNLFVRSEGRWRMVAHHGSGVVTHIDDGA